MEEMIIKIYEFGLVSNGLLLASTINNRLAYKDSDQATNYLDLKGALIQAIIMYIEAMTNEFISHFSMETYLVLLEKFDYHDNDIIFFLICEKKKRRFKDLLRDQNLVACEQMKPKFAKIFKLFRENYKIPYISNELSKYKAFLDEVAALLNFEAWDHKLRHLF